MYNRDNFDRKSYAKGYVKGRHDEGNVHLASIAKSLERIANHMESDKAMDKMAQGIHNAIENALFNFWRERM